MKTYNTTKDTRKINSNVTIKVNYASTPVIKLMDKIKAKKEEIKKSLS